MNQPHKKTTDDAPTHWPPPGTNRFGEKTRYAGTEYGETAYDGVETPGIGPGLKRLLALIGFLALAWGGIGLVVWLLWPS